MDESRENTVSPGGYLSTTAGKIFTATIAAAVLGAGIAYARNAAAAKAAAPAPGGALTPAPAPAPGSIAPFLFNVAYPAAAVVTPAQAVADLTAAGFTGILIQPDPTLADSFLVAATYGPGLTYSTQVQTAVTTAPAAGTLDFSIAAPSQGTGGQAGIYNLTPITSLPTVTPVALSVGQWYSFSVQTSFLQSATNAQADVVSLLQSMGFGSAAAPPTGVAPVTQSSPGVPIPATAPSAFDVWNVIAQFTAASGGGSGSVTFTPGGSAPATASVPDLPPVLMFVAGALPTPIAAPTGTPAPTNVMP